MAQQPIWKNLNANDGLEALGVTSFAQTPDGMMWIGTQTGLLKYNGRVFTPIHANQSSQPYIECLVSDKYNNVWCATRQGFYKYDAQNQQLNFLQGNTIFNALHRALCWNNDSSILYAATSLGVFGYSINNQTITKKEQISELYLNNILFVNGCIYLQNYHQLLKIDKNKAVTLLVSLNNIENVVYDYVSGCWIIASNTGNFIFNERKKSLTPFAREVNPLQFTHEQCLHIDAYNQIWFINIDSLFCYQNIHDKQPKIVPCSEDKYSAPRNIIGIYNDKQGRIWAGTGQMGISIFDNRVLHTKYMHPKSIESATIWSVYYDTSNHLFVYGTGNDVVVYNSITKDQKHIRKPNAKSRFAVTTIQSVNKQYWFIGSYGGGNWLLDKQTYKWEKLNNFTTDSKTNQYYPLNDTEYLIAMVGAIYKGNFKTKQFDVWNPQIEGNILSVDRVNNQLWIASTSSIYITDLKGNILTKLKEHTKQEYNGNGSQVMSLKREGEFVYLASMNQGISRYHIHTKKYESVRLEPAPNMAYGIVKGEKNNIYFTTDKGLFQYNPVTQKHANINKQNNFPINDYEQFGFFENDSMIVVVGPDGVLFSAKNRLEQFFNDTLVLDLVYQNNIVKAITIPAGKQELNCEIFSHHANLFHPLQYTYQLLGLEDSTHISADGLITYNYIPPGKYQLIIDVKNPNHTTPNKQLVYSVNVLPIWYQTTWFKIICLFVLATLLAFVVRYFSILRYKWRLQKLEAQQKLAKERTRISRELHDNVGSQLTYLITGLEASELLHKKQQNEKLGQNLEQLQLSARDSMQQLRDSVWALNIEEVTLSILMDRLKNWIRKMLEHQHTQLQFDAHLAHDCKLDATTSLNLYRLMQEAIHNIIKHANASTINIEIQSDEQNIHCKIADNGKGFLTTKTEGNGLSNMHVRARELNATFTLKSELQKGTTISIQIPINTLNGL